MVKARIIGTRNAREFLPIGVKILREGGSALDAVEATVRAVEDNPLDTSVGYGGIPNLMGVVELDASIMDGRTLRTGAVAGIKHFKNPISIAKKVLEVSPHVLLIADGAEAFAEAMGFEKCELLTDYTKTLYEAFLKDAIPDLDERFARWRVSLPQTVKTYNMKEWYARLSEHYHGTVNVIAMDAKGDLCTGVSTSGTALKWPGRLGDSPIIGAGNYADNRYGATACTGRGELTIRLLSARMIVAYVRCGMGIGEACLEAMREVRRLNETGGINCIAMDARGNTFSAGTGSTSMHCYMDVDSNEPQDRMGSVV